MYNEFCNFYFKEKFYGFYCTIYCHSTFRKNIKGINAAVLGNMLPIPFILLFIEKIFAWMKKSKHFHKIPDWLEKKALSKSAQIEKYGYLGLFLFVAIPLPGTGAWTGSLIAVLFGMKPKKSLLFIFLGVLTAGLIMSLLSFGVLKQLIS